MTTRTKSKGQWIKLSELTIHPDLEKLGAVDLAKIAYFREAFLNEGFNEAFPLKVTRRGRYLILNGRHRFLGAMAAGIEAVFCVVIDATDEAIKRIIIEENLIGIRRTVEPAEKRIIDSYHTQLRYAAEGRKYRHDPWSVANVSKQKWYQVTKEVKACLSVLLEQQPMVSSAESLFRAITDPAFCPPLYDLYRRQRTASARRSSQRPSQNLDAAAALAMMNRALTDMVSRMPAMPDNLKKEVTDHLNESTEVDLRDFHKRRATFMHCVNVVAHLLNHIASREEVHRD